MAARLPSRPEATLFDPIRKQWLIATPEELVRQRLINYLLGIGVPIHRILVEVSVAKLVPYRAPAMRGIRRIDLAVIIPGSSKLALIAECKAVPITQAALSQIIAYQSFLRAQYLVLAAPKEVWTWSASLGHNAAQGWVYGMPTKEQLGV